MIVKHWVELKGTAELLSNQFNITDHYFVIVIIKYSLVLYDEWWVRFFMTKYCNYE